MTTLLRRAAVLLLLCLGSIMGEEETPTTPSYLELRQEHESTKMADDMEEKALFIRLPHSQVIDNYGKFHLSWDVDTDREEITLEFVVETLGWIGFGLSPSGQMMGADIVTGWVDDEGVGHIQDRHGTGDVLPEMDEQQDWRLLRASENDTHTTMVVVRDLSTCDDKDMPFVNTSRRLIYAYGTEDPTNATSLQYHGHTSRGSRYLALLNPPTTEKEMPDDAQKWTLIQKRTMRGDRDTLYWCNIVQFPHEDTQLHYIGYKIQHGKNSFKYLHHILVWECPGDPTSAGYTQQRERLSHYASQDGHECYTENMPPDYTKCNSPILTWTVGLQGGREPDHVGLPLVPKEGGKVFFMIEAHYDNVDLADNTVVEWGMDLFYTDKLRKFESGSMFVGSSLDIFMVIPPKQNEWTVAGHCSAGCLVEGLPESGIKIYQVLPHAHTTGRKIRVRHFRDGQELPPLLVDDYYDFNFQQLLVLEEERTILPSDHLTTECTFDSSSRKNVTFSGFRSQDEMCTAILYYYPRRSLVECSSSTHYEVVKEVFGIEEFANEADLMLSVIDKQQANPYLSKKKTDFHSYISGIKWADYDLKEVQQKMSRGTHANTCMKRGAVPAQAFKLKTGYPDAEPYKAPEDSCPRMLSQRTQKNEEPTIRASSGASSNFISLTCLLLTILRTFIHK